MATHYPDSYLAVQIENTIDGARRVNGAAMSAARDARRLGEVMPILEDMAAEMVADMYAIARAARTQEAALARLLEELNTTGRVAPPNLAAPAEVPE